MKKAIATNVFFFILMGLMFIWILVFGIQKLYFTFDTITETERLEVKKEITDALEYCNDPLNAGNIRTVKVDNAKFNSLCIIQDRAFVLRDVNGRVVRNPTTGALQINPQLQPLYDTMRPIYDGGKNVVLLKTRFSNDKVLEDYQIIDAMDVDVEVSGGYSMCLFDYENKGYFDIKIPCE